MVTSINKVSLLGNVGKDPDIRTKNDSKEMASFSMATTETWKDKTTGERREKTEWHRIVIFHEGVVNIVKNYVKKGSRLYIEGNLQTRKWTDQSGQEKYATEIVLQNASASLVLLDPKSGAGNGDYGQRDGGSSHFNNNDLDDEVPF